MYRVVLSRPGVVRLADGSALILRVAVVGVKYAGFSPFGGANFAVKTTGGVAALSVPEELRERVRDKPLSPSTGFRRTGGSSSRSASRSRRTKLSR